MSLYRCSVCRHGNHLFGYAQAVSYGPLGADGQLARHDDVDDCFLFVDSIECARHPDIGRIETKIGSRFHVWETCSTCKGEGKSPFLVDARPVAALADTWCSLAAPPLCLVGNSERRIR